MGVKVEIISTTKPPGNIETLVNQVFDSVPKEHTRGISKVVIVDEIKDPRLAALTSQPQPVLYHPKTPGAQAFIELAISFFLAKGESFYKRWAARLNFRAQVAGALLASIGQHYHLTFSYGIKKTNYEAPVRAYVEKHFIVWREKNAGWRGKLFKPIQPYLERLEKWMRKKMSTEQKKKQPTSTAKSQGTGKK